MARKPKTHSDLEWWHARVAFSTDRLHIRAGQTFQAAAADVETITGVERSSSPDVPIPSSFRGTDVVVPDADMLTAAGIVPPAAATSTDNGDPDGPPDALPVDAEGTVGDPDGVGQS